jgi:hypothetical protein
VPVVIRNMPAQAPQSHINLQQLKTISIGSIGASAGPLAASPLETAISESGTSGSRFITDPSQFGSPEVAAGGLGGDGLGSSPSMLTDMFGKSLAGAGQFSPNGFPTMGDLAYGDGSPNGIFSTLQKTVGGPGGTTGFAGPVSGYGGGSPGSSSSGSGGMFGGLLKGIGGLFGKGGSSAPTGEIDLETGAPLGHDIPGSANNASGETSAGIGGAAGAMLMMAGTTLAMDGLRRKPGVASAIETPAGAAMIGAKFGGMQGGMIGAGIGLGADGLRRGGYKGMMETAAGGALIGSQVGGPAGALVGAVIGGAIGTVRMFMESDRDHIKKLVKQVYGMDINNSMADQIAVIAKQSFGGAHDVAVRSPQVRELLRLYAQTTGQKSAEDKFVADTVHGASLVEAGGKLQQQAIYDNGSGYAYASPFGTYQGVQTSPLPTYGSTSGGGPTHVQLVLNGQAAADVLAGQVSRVATPSFVQGQSQAALGSSIGRNSQTAMALAPASISR